MLAKRAVFLLTILLVFFFGWRMASAFMVAKAIAPPHASSTTILGMVVHPRFHMATPHRNLLTAIRFTLIPTAQACNTPDCTAEEAKAVTDPNCPHDGYWYYCPTCSQVSGCTWWECRYTGRTHYICSTKYGTTPCQTCLTSTSNQACIPPGPG
jgi:hypothetical protein